MKKVGTFLLNSVILFGSYFLISSLFILVLQTVLRIFIDANSKGEFLWKTLCMYAFMAVTMAVFLSATRSSEKAKYFAYMEGREKTFGETALYVLHNKDFWMCSAGFAIWPILLPMLFGSINRLYLSAELYRIFPLSILSMLTVSSPILVLSFVAWVFVLRDWEKDRLHKS